MTALEEAVSRALHLSALDKIRLIERIVSTLERDFRTSRLRGRTGPSEAEAAAPARAADDRPRTNLRSLKGLGKDLWRDRDAQEYVDQLRAEWD